MRYFSIYIEKTNDFYTYASEDKEIKIGDRVLVSFRNKDKVGLVIEEEIGKEYSFKVLNIKKVLYEELNFSKNFINLLLWIKQYYMSSFEQVFSTAVPAGIKIKYEDVYRINTEKENLLRDELLQYFYDKLKIRKKTLVDRFSKEMVNEFVEENQLQIVEGWYTLNKNFKNLNSELLKYFKTREEIGKLTLEKKFEKKVIEKHLKEGSLFFERKIKSFNEDKLKKDLEEKKLKKDTELNSE
ncbi:MAG: replication restart helicase PriA, partial [Cetobacterium sp.]